MHEYFVKTRHKKQRAWHAILKWDDVFAFDATNRSWFPLNIRISVMITGIVAGSFVDLLLLSETLLIVIIVVNNDSLWPGGPHFQTNLCASSTRRRWVRDFLH